MAKFHTIESRYPPVDEPRLTTTRTQSSFFQRNSRSSRRSRTLPEAPADPEGGGPPQSLESKPMQRQVSPRELMEKERGRSINDVRAPLLATRYRLKFHEVKIILDGFDRMLRARPEGAEDGGVTAREFGSFLCQVFEVPSIPEETLAGAYEASKGTSGKIDIDAFLQWYTINMFTIVNVLNADLEQSNTNELIYSLAKKHQVSTMVIDKVKRKFDMYDTDGSGEIDLDEFRFLLTVLLKVKTDSDLSQDRVMRAWKEIDVDHSGGVDFSEFTEWYLKYLGPNEDEDFVRGPAEAFYDSYNPTVQRRQCLNSAMWETMGEETW